VTAAGVYISGPCGTYDFLPASGSVAWSQDLTPGGCNIDFSEQGTIPVVANQLVYSFDAPDVNVDQATEDTLDAYNAATGSSTGTFSAVAPGAFTSDMGFFLQSGSILQGISLSDGSVKWSFSGDGQLADSPIVVNQYVFIASTAGNLYALDADSGAPVWQVALGNAIVTGRPPLSGLAAGDGLLVVPAGQNVIAYTLSSNP